jgi:DNA-directed RNA polymerase specialized sigma24 family protein
MRHGHLDPVNPQTRKPASCRCGASDPEDAELRALFHDLAMTLYQLMDPVDADILTRAEMQGQTPEQIADQIGCSQAEATRRLAHAQRCFCQLATQSFASANSR